MKEKLNIKSAKVIYKDTHIQVKQDLLERDSFTWNQVYLQWNYKDAVCVIPYESGGVYLIRQYRHPLKKYLWQFPGGLFEKGFKGLALAKKELQEEAGMRAKKYRKLGVFTPEPGLTTAHIHVYLAEGLSKAPRQLEKSEIGMKLKHYKMSFIRKAIQSGKISCGITLSALYLFELAGYGA